MAANGDRRDVKAVGNLCRAEPPAQEIEHLGFPPAQLDRRTCGQLESASLVSISELLQHRAEHRTREGGLPVYHPAEGAGERVRRHGLLEVSRCAGLHGLEKLMLVCCV